MSTLTITRIAHSSVLIDIDGHAILTDPWYSERPGYWAIDRISRLFQTERKY